jgi:effector-binding domain-containing protein
MIDTPRIVRTEVVPTACIHLTVRPDEMMKVMGPGYRELMAALESQGIAPAGPWLNHFLKIAPGIFDFELSVPVPRPVKPVGRVRPGELPATTVARTVYHGPYEGLPGAWPELDAWISAQGRKPVGILWEVYLAGPESSADPARWRTELNRPLAG